MRTWLQLLKKNSVHEGGSIAVEKVGRRTMADLIQNVRLQAILDGSIRWEVGRIKEGHPGDPHFGEAN